MTIDFAKDAAWLAAQIGERTPQIENMDAFREYAEHVAEQLQSRSFGVSLLLDRLREHLDPETWRREFHTGRARMTRRMKRQTGLKALRRAGADSSKRRGEETRANVARGGAAGATAGA